METISGITYSWSENVTLKQIVIQYIKICKLRRKSVDMNQNLEYYIELCKRDTESRFCTEICKYDSECRFVKRNLHETLSLQ